MSEGLPDEYGKVKKKEYLNAANKHCQLCGGRMDAHGGVGFIKTFTLPDRIWQVAYCSEEC